MESQSDSLSKKKITKRQSQSKGTLSFYPTQLFPSTNHILTCFTVQPMVTFLQAHYINKHNLTNLLTILFFIQFFSPSFIYSFYSLLFASSSSFALSSFLPVYYLYEHPIPSLLFTCILLLLPSFLLSFLPSFLPSFLTSYLSSFFFFLFRLLLQLGIWRNVVWYQFNTRNKG